MDALLHEFFMTVLYRLGFVCHLCMMQRQFRSAQQTAVVVKNGSCTVAGLVLNVADPLQKGGRQNGD
ncbi:hypothetical protein [Kiloniella sp. b19]|uniref:hypothetical protein n=1 Tax=Kiloniella sp. GXU_MW_B19 TaxID=3141326 RepID=UPI0031DC9759